MVYFIFLFYPHLCTAHAATVAQEVELVVQ